MDLYPAPLSINKKKSLPAVERRNEQPQKPVLVFGRSTSARASARSSSGESTVVPSNSPPQLTERPRLDIPKVRRSKSHGQPSTNGGSGAAYHKNGTRILSLARSTYNKEGHIQSLKAIRTDSQTSGKMSQLLHALDKKLIKPSTREFSKRLSKLSPQIELPFYPLWKYNFSPPVSLVKMDMHVDDSLSDFKKAEVYVHLTITIDVSLESVQYIPYGLSVTAVILLNMTSDREMIRVTAMAQVILDKLQEDDFVVIACVNFECSDCIDVLFSARGNCNSDLARLLSDCASTERQLINGAFRDDELLGVAVDNSFQLFDSSSHSVPHVFLVSANRDTTLNTRYNAAVGLTTVTLEDHCEFVPAPRPGWHIYPDLNLDQSSSCDFRQKVDKALCHIRSGFSSGNITDLSLRFVLASGCEIQVCGRTSIASLRPGETWKVLARVNSTGEQGRSKLEREIKSMLQYSDITNTDIYRGENILVATLRFNHSLQPGCSLKMVKACSIVRE